MADKTVPATAVFQDICKQLKGFNYTEYEDMEIFDANTDDFCVTFKLDKATGTIIVCSSVQDYRNDRDYGEESEIV